MPEKPSGVPEQEHTTSVHPPRSLERRQKEREDKLLAERHRTAVAACRVEEFVSWYVESALQSGFSKATIKAEIDKEIGEQFAHLPPHLQKRYRGFVMEYIEQAQEAQSDEQKLRKQAGIEEQFKYSQDINSQMGSYLFKRYVGKAPAGEVFARRKEAYFMLACQAKEDFEHLATVLNAKPESGGFFAERNRLIVINDSPYEVDTTLTVDHERQHFLNIRIFDEFIGLEPTTRLERFKAHPEAGLDSRKGLSWQLRYIKDEILAQCRNLGPDDDLSKILNLSLYAELFRKLPPERKAQIHILVQDISQALKQSFPVFTTRAERALLINHLLDIPLPRFPDWIRAVAKFYQRKGDQ